MFTILDFAGVKETAEKLYLSGKAAEDTLPAMVKISEDMLEAEAALFSSQGRRGGGSWAALKPATAARKGSSRILFQTGALEESLSRRGALFQILNIHPTEIEFGTDRPAAGVHQAGAPGRGIPRRPIIKFTASDVQTWTDILMNHIIKVFDSHTGDSYQRA